MSKRLSSTFAPITIIIVLALLLTRPGRSATASDAPRATSPGAIWQLTYLKAKPGEVDRLATFIERNWFAVDARAKAAGHLEAYRLLRGTPADTTWDFLELSVYRDSMQHARIDSLFRAVYRPRHQTQLVDGKSFAELGSVVKSVTTRRVGGMP